MSEIKVGDRVKIADTVDQEKYSKTRGWATAMKNFLGTEGTVIEVNSEIGWAIVDCSEPGGFGWAWNLDDLTVVPVVPIGGHKHAALMMEYAKDAQTHERPWELWEARFDSDSEWEANRFPLWVPEYEYRRKPAKKMVLVNGVEVPAPETTAPADNTEYWLSDPTQYGKTIGPITWNGRDHDRLQLSRGVVYLNKEDAVARAEAMLITEEVDC